MTSANQIYDGSNWIQVPGQRIDQIKTKNQMWNKMAKNTQKMAILVNKNNAIFGYFWAIFKFLARNGHFSIVGQKRPFLGIFGNFPIVAIFPFLAKNDPKMPPFFSFQKWPFLGLFRPFSHFWPKIAIFPVLFQNYQTI